MVEPRVRQGAGQVVRDGRERTTKSGTPCFAKDKLGEGKAPEEFRRAEMIVGEL